MAETPLKFGKFRYNKAGPISFFNFLFPDLVVLSAKYLQNTFLAEQNFHPKIMSVHMYANTVSFKYK